MTDRWDLWVEAWAAWDEANAAGRPGVNGFAGYDLWKSNVGPWPSTEDVLRPPRARRALGSRGTKHTTPPLLDPEDELDLTGDERAVSDPEPVLDLTDDELDLTHDVRTLADDRSSRRRPR